MKKNIFILFTLSLVVLLSACDEKADTVKTDWQIAQDAGFESITRKIGTEGYNSLPSKSNAGFIVYKEIIDGNGAKPLFTDKAKILYTGWFKRDWSKGDTYINTEGQTVQNKVIFDSTSQRGDVPSTFPVASTSSNYGSSGIIDGMSTALQNMEVGDKWEIWIPQELGYGSSAKSSIPAYTTLVFEIELLAVIK